MYYGNEKCFVRLEVLKAVNAHMLNYMVSCNLPIHSSLKFWVYYSFLPEIYRYI
jgi:hypothetical protein